MRILIRPLPTTYTALAYAALASLSSTAALGQAPSSDLALEEVVITGSRLNATGFTTPTPVTVLGAEQLEERAPAALSEVLNEMPSFRPAGRTQSNRTVTNPAGGQASPDLRSLGAARTLTMIDGRRQVGSNTNLTIDTNRIPTMMIERLDVVTGGASAAYGSDAVAGVVNIIMNDKISGIKGSLQHGRSEHNDAKDTAISLAGGMDYGSGGHFIIGGDYSDDGGVGNILSRSWGRKEPGLLTTGSLAANNIGPNQTFANGVETSNATPGGLITSVTTASSPLFLTAFGPGGTPYKFDRGTVDRGGTLMSGTQGNYGIAPLISFQLLNPIKRANLMARTRYEINDNLTLLGDVSYSHLHTIGEIVTNTQSYIIKANNPFLPASVLAAMNANTVNGVPTPLTQITVGRVTTDLGPPTADTKNNTLQFNGGARGSFANWTWDANYGYGQNETNFSVLNQPQQSNQAAAVNAIRDANGNIVCDLTPGSNPNFNTTTLTKTPSKVMAGCVPYNVFGTGVNSDAAINYVRQTGYTDFNISMHDVAANLRGDLFMLPAGAVKFATGAEWRREDMKIHAGDVAKMVALNIANGVDVPNISRTVYEGYTEFGVPLLKDLPGAKSLDLNGAYRYTHYSNSGSVNTWKAGLTYEPIQALRLRATKSRDIRAPNLFELGNVGAPSAVNANFQNPFTGTSQVLVGQASGNPNLVPEIADSFTAGIVFQPDFLRSLSISVDYYDIKLNGAIVTVSADNVVSRCRAGDQSYCSAITFTGAVNASSVAVVQTLPRNLNVRTAKGFDIELSYKPDISTIGLPGTLATRLLVNINKEQVETDSSGLVLDSAGTANGSPDWAANFSVAYGLDRFSMVNQIRGFAGVRGSPSLIGPGEPGYNPNVSSINFGLANGGTRNTISKNSWPTKFYWNLAFSFDVTNTANTKLQTFFNVDNVLDSDPPEFAAVAFALNQVQNYDLIGRRYKAGIRFQFN